MALFFDQTWFERKLAAAGMDRDDLARALGLTRVQLDELFKDQRELRDSDVAMMALLLGASEAEIRSRGGVQGSPEARAALSRQRGQSGGGQTGSGQTGGGQPSPPLSAPEAAPAPPPPSAAPDSQALEARLERIEAKLDRLLALLGADRDR